MGRIHVGFNYPYPEVRFSLEFYLNKIVWNLFFPFEFTNFNDTIDIGGGMRGHRVG
jgi:hypothetical protein